MRKPIIVGNWKMNKTMTESRKNSWKAVDGVAASDGGGDATYGVGAPYTGIELTADAEMQKT